MNIVGLVINDKHCSVVDHEGNIRIMTKKNDSAKEKFKDYLELENMEQDISKKILDIKNEKIKNSDKIMVNAVEMVLSILFLIIGQTVLSLPIILFLIKTILSVSSVVFLSFGIEKVIKAFKLKKLLNNQKEKMESIKKELYTISEKMGLYNFSGFLYEVNKNNSEGYIMKIEESIKEMFLRTKSYVNNNGEEIDSVKKFSFNNDYISNPEKLISLPLSDDETSKASKIVQDVGRRKSINELLSLKLDLLSLKENDNSKIMIKK